MGKALIILTVWALWPGALLAVFSRRDLPTVERPLRAIDAERVELVAWFFTCLGIIVFLIGAETKEEAALVAGGTNLIAGMVLNASAILSALVGGLRGEPSRRALRAMVPAFVLALVHQGAFDAVFGGKPADLPGSLVLSWLGQIWMPLGLAALYLAWKLVTRPMKQRERTRLFVELLETCVAEGRSAEEAISELSRRGDPTFGPEFRRLAERAPDW